MRKIELEPHKINLEDFKRRNAAHEDYPVLIKESFVAYLGTEQKIAYKILDWETQDMIQSLQTMKYATSNRVDGMPSTSAIFGYMPRRIPYHDYCRATAMVHEYPSQHQMICEYAKKIAAEYKILAPDDFAIHEETIREVKPNWKIEGTPFTSGIINKDNQLWYHFDAGNFKKAKSCMISFKHRVQGGHLSIPDYGIGIEIANNSLLIFDGATTLHGVTPIYKEDPSAYRFSAVFYSLQQMWKCMTPGEELTRIRKLKTQREFKRARGEEGK